MKADTHVWYVDKIISTNESSQVLQVIRMPYRIASALTYITKRCREKCEESVYMPPERREFVMDTIIDTHQNYYKHFIGDAPERITVITNGREAMFHAGSILLHVEPHIQSTPTDWKFGEKVFAATVAVTRGDSALSH
jgi:hypothetical protein